MPSRGSDASCGAMLVPMNASTQSYPWPVPEIFPSLGAGEVHVWSVDLTGPSSWLGECRKVLSSEETDRAGRFKFDRDRDAYVIGRGTLRHLLARYLATDPERLRFQYQAHGKPELAPFFQTPSGGPIEFNLSHSGGEALIALTLDGPLGVDLERFRESVLRDGLAERFFAPEEAEVLASLKNEEQLPAFFQCWTRKEAFLKAHGGGLSMGLDSFAVTLRPHDPPALLWFKGDPEASRRWRIHTLSTPPDFAANLVAPTSANRVQCFRWTERMKLTSGH